MIEEKDNLKEYPKVSYIVTELRTSHEPANWPIVDDGLKSLNEHFSEVEARHFIELAVQMLVELGKADIERLLSAFEDAAPVNEIVGSILNYLGFRACLPTSADWIQILVADALGKLKDKRAVQPLTQILQNIRGSTWGSMRLLESVVDALVNIGDNIAVPALVEILKVTGDRDLGPNSKLTIVDALSEFGFHSEIAALMKDNDSSIRFHAARLLGEFQNVLALESLLEALQDKSNEVQSRVIMSIVLLGNRDALPQKILEEPSFSPEQRLKLLESLSQLNRKTRLPGGDNYEINYKGFDVRAYCDEMLQHCNESVRGGAMAVLAAMQTSNGDNTRRSTHPTFKNLFRRSKH